MLNSIFDSTTVPILEQVAKFAQTRHGILAGNIANLDTPGYHVRDLDHGAFQARLRSEIETRDAQAGSLSAEFGSSSSGMASAASSLEDILYHDDSTGGLEQQVTAIAKNQLEHNLALAILSSQMRLLQAAISERA